MVRMEAVDVDLTNAILTQIELSQLPQLLKVLNLHDLVVRRVEDFEFFERTVLQAVKVLELIAGDIKELKIGHALEASLVATILSTMLNKERLNPVVAQFQDLKRGQITKATQGDHLVVAQVEISQIRPPGLIEHIIKVSQLASR